MRYTRKLPVIRSLTGFYVIVTLGMVTFSLLTYLPAKVVANDVTMSAVLWGTNAFICFVLLVFTFLLDTLCDEIVRRRRK